MNKRGQFYILVALIVCFLAFIVVSKANTIQEQIALQNFDSFAQNYLEESARVTNEELANQNPDVNSKLSTFTNDFVDYARKKDPNLGVVYIYGEGENLIIKNYLNGETLKVVNVGGGTPIVNLLSTNAGITGNFEFEGTGIGITANTPAGEAVPDKTVVATGNIDKIEIQIGDLVYPFDVSSTPNIAVIIKSEEGDTIKVKVKE